MSDSGPGSPEWVTLDADEHVRFVVSPSRNLVLASLAIGFSLLITMSVGVGLLSDLATGRIVSLATLVLIVALLIGAYALTGAYQYVLTSDRAVVGTGLWRKRADSVTLQAVTDVVVDQPIWQRLLSVGTVQLVTTTGATVEFKFVESPAVLGQQIRRLAAVDETDTPPA
jgi:uncharacterized membrane protein YdbT with pleckstrin-like domain